MLITERQCYQECSYVRMADGTRLAYTLWRPKDIRRYPTLLNYSSYAESGTTFDQARRFLDAGYAYIGVNVRGTGASEGAYSYYQPAEAEDGAAVIEWAAAQRWSTGNIGMVGPSYGAHTQIAVAALRPLHLKAIVPISVEGNEYRDEAMTGGLFNAAMMAEWVFKTQPDLARRSVDARIAAGDAECGAIHARQPANPSYEEVLEHPLFDEWWRARSLDAVIGQVTVPTLIIHAWQDEWIRPNGAIRLFKLLNHVRKRLVLQNGQHVLSGYLINQREQMRWLDRWVKGESNGVELEPPVTVHWEVTEQEESASASPGWTTTYAEWPPSNLEWLSFYLTAAGELGPEAVRACADHGARRYVYPLGTELMGSAEQFRLAPYPLGTLSYRTARMKSDMVILGAPQLSFYFSSDQPDTDFMFTLKDIDSAGNTLFLQRSVLRASLRAVDQASSTSDEIVQKFTHVEKLVPGEIYDVRLSLSALGHVVREGHRLELSILSPGAVPNPVWGFAPALPSSVNTLYHSDRYPSELKLPVLPGEKAQKSTPDSGALRNQPCRPARHDDGRRNT